MTQTYIGAPVLRKEDLRFLTGTARYVDDVKLPHMLHAAILRSPHAHARILSIDTSAALEMEGVAAVYTFQDIVSAVEPRPIPMRRGAYSGLERFLQYPLAGEKVRYVGDPVAVVVAESRYLAEDALDAVPSTYREAARALGATDWQIIWRVTLPAARSGVLTAVMLGIGRVIGETLGKLDEDSRARLRAGRVGFVFQNFQLLPTLTALENVLLPLELSPLPDSQSRARDWLTRVGLGERLE
ncbi:MAG: ABC transporter permease subunit, partial [Chloroflexi bacterium]|nr:ABC transporter permease subunit [Chloroflexota bacterium]